RADVRRAVAEEADGDLLRAAILCRPRRAVRDREMRADDRVAAKHVVLDARQMHRAALAAHQARRVAHELAQDRGHRHAAHERVVMAAIRTEGVILGPHGDAEARRDSLLAEREMTRALD